MSDSDRTLDDLLRDRFARFATRIALVDDGGRETSYAELDRRAESFARTLAGAGAEPGDRVLVQVDKSVEAIALYLGCLRGGFVYVPVSPAYTEAEVEYFVGDADPRLIVRPTVDDIARRSTVVSVPESAAEGLAAILYTSGTTGRAKGAMLSHRNLTSNGLALSELWSFSERDVHLHVLPIHHVHGLFVALHCALFAGASTRLVARFDVERVRALLPAATVMMGVPTLYARLLADADFGRSQCEGMRLFVSGSAPLLAEAHRAFRERTGMAILERYGMTETGILTSNPLIGERVPGTVGFPLPAVEVRIVADDGSELASGEAGAVEVRGPNVFAGYWQRPERTGEDFRDGWFRTGDLGVRDREGRLTLVGRAKDLIISGGFNVYPKEIEGVLEVAGVAESAVVGVPDPDRGEIALALIVATPGAPPTEEQLRAAVAERLARYKHPRRYVFVDELPRNALGKVRKDLLRARFAGS